MDDKEDPVDGWLVCSAENETALVTLGAGELEGMGVAARDVVVNMREEVGMRPVSLRGKNNISSCQDIEMNDVVEQNISV